MHKLCAKYEEKYEEKMSYQQMREAYLFYTGLNDTNDIFFKIYNECSSTLNYNTENFMDWSPISLDTFLKNFQ